jgi:hypothetical protein
MHGSSKWVLRSLFGIDNRSKSNWQQKLLAKKLFELEILRDSKNMYFTSMIFIIIVHQTILRRKPFCSSVFWKYMQLGNYSGIST